MAPLTPLTEIGNWTLTSTSVLIGNWKTCWNALVVPQGILVTPQGILLVLQPHRAKIMTRQRRIAIIFFISAASFKKYMSHNNSAHGCVPGTAAQFVSVTGRDDSTADVAAGAGARRDRV